MDCTEINGICGLDPSTPEGQELFVYRVAVSMHDGWASISTTPYATVGEFVTVLLSCANGAGRASGD